MVSPLLDTTQDEFVGSSDSNKLWKSINFPRAIFVFTDSFKNRPIGTVEFEKEPVFEFSAATENCSCVTVVFTCSSVELNVSGKSLNAGNICGSLPLLSISTVELICCLIEFISATSCC